MRDSPENLATRTPEIAKYYTVIGLRNQEYALCLTETLLNVGTNTLQESLALVLSLTLPLSFLLLSPTMAKLLSLADEVFAHISSYLVKDDLQLLLATLGGNRALESNIQQSIISKGKTYEYADLYIIPEDYEDVLKLLSNPPKHLSYLALSNLNLHISLALRLISVPSLQSVHIRNWTHPRHVPSLPADLSTEISNITRLDLTPNCYMPMEVFEKLLETPRRLKKLQCWVPAASYNSRKLGLLHLKGGAVANMCHAFAPLYHSLQDLEIRRRMCPIPDKRDPSRIELSSMTSLRKLRVPAGAIFEDESDYGSRTGFSRFLPISLEELYVSGLQTSQLTTDLRY